MPPDETDERLSGPHTRSDPLMSEVLILRVGSNGLAVKPALAAMIAWKSAESFQTAHPAVKKQ